MDKIDKGTLIRTVALVVVLLNQLLMAFHFEPLPWSGEAIGQAISGLLTVLVALWTWWKNNYVSRKGLKQKEVLEKHELT